MTSSTDIEALDEGAVIADHDLRPALAPAEARRSPSTRGERLRLAIAVSGSWVLSLCDPGKLSAHVAWAAPGRFDSESDGLRRKQR